MLPSSHAAFFNDLMRYLWGDNEPEHLWVVRAVGDRIRGTKSVNPENALDVLDALGAASSLKSLTVRPADDNPGIAIWDITFGDDSRAIIEAHHGIGSGVELIQG